MTIAGIVIFIAILLTGCSGQSTPVQKTDSVLKTDSALHVALYPYVPDMERFQEAVSDVWEEEHPDVDLKFVDWDCYTSDPDPVTDVFVFDGIYLSSFVEDGYLLPIPEEKIQKKEDIYPFALKGCSCEGEFYALPQMLCADFLYTRKADRELLNVSDIKKLHDLLGDRKTRSVIPKENEGLLINLSDVLLTKTMIYLDALMDEKGEYTDYSELPSSSRLSDQARERLNDLWRMGGDRQVSYWPENNDSFIRARWFAQGKGRAYIGYSEALAAMDDYADDVSLRLFTYGTEKNVALFYTDMVGISSKISEDKKNLAFDLANVLISEEVLTKMSMPGKDADSPQYLLTARKSVYKTLSRDYPIYRRLEEIVDGKDNHVFRIGADARGFIKDMEEALSEQMDSE